MKKEYAPKEHPRLRRTPFREPTQVPEHRVLEHVALLAIEPRNRLCVRLEPVISPRIQDGKRNRLRERRGLQVRDSGLVKP